jgi:hypothetical protein
MKIMRTALACFGVLVVLALTTTPARAGNTDCSGAASTCGFGTSFLTTSGTLIGGGHSVAFQENVYTNGSVYTYVFQLTNGNNVGIDSAKVLTLVGGFGDNFNCGNGSCLNFGVVDGGISAVSSNTNDTFAWGSLSLTVDYGTLLNNQSFTFYVQGGAPAAGVLSAGNLNSTAYGNVFTAASEPGVVALLGSSFMLYGGMVFVGRLRSREA